MPDGTNNSQELLMPGRIRMIITGALEITGDTDATLDEEKLDSLLPEVSRIMGLRVVLHDTPKRGMKVSQLTTFIHEHQAQFEPFPEQPENPSSTNETEPV